MPTKRELELRERQARYAKKLEQVQNDLEKIENRERGEAEKKRNARLYNKAANEEALFAFEQMDILTHLEFIHALTRIDTAAELIFKYHIATGGTQYVSVEDFRNYVAVKYPECRAKTESVISKAAKRVTQKEADGSQ